MKNIINHGDKYYIYEDNKYWEVLITTDVNLKLSKFPQPFIKEFVERQGKDVDVLVEVEEYIVQSFGLATVNGYEEPLTDYRIKLNPDNTVNLIFK